LDEARGQRDVFVQMAAYATGGLNLTGGAEPMRATITYVTSDFFSVLGRQPFIGRPFATGEMAAGGPKAVILSHAIWQRQFGADSSVITKRVALNGVSYDVVGVMPRDFTFPARTDLWIALQLPVQLSIYAAFRNYLPTGFVARLAPGVSVAQAAQRMEALRRRYRAQADPDDTPIAELARPLHDRLVGQGKTSLYVLMGSAGLLLLIACANVTNLLLSRASTRQREIALRVTLGATRLRVVRQLIVESVLLALVGGVLALVVAWFTVGALATVLPPALAAVAPPRLDGRVFGFTMLLTIGTAMLFGLWPAIGLSRVGLNDAIKPGGGTATRRGRGARGVLVVAEISLSLMLVVGAGLLLESLRTLLAVDAGIRTANVVTARLTLPRAKYPGTVARTTFINGVLERLRGVPVIQHAAMVNALPMERDRGVSLRARPEEAPQDTTRLTYASYLAATPGYFATLGTPLRGSDLPATYDSTRQVVVINQALANILWPSQDPVGRRLDSPAGGIHTVIGVVADIRAVALDQKADPQMYMPMAEASQDYVSIVVRGTGDTGSLVAAIREAVRSVDPAQPIYAAQTMEQVVSASVATRRTNTILLSVFGGLALLLAAIGVYAVLAYGVAQRTREIGVRVALGAQSADVIRLIVGHGAVLAVIGVAVGLAAAYALARFLAVIVYEVGVHDPRVFVAAPLVLLGVALLATWLPARRAAKVDPMEALREA
jgi:putative ABC transport system permease protein